MGAYYCRFHWLPQIKKRSKNFSFLGTLLLVLPLNFVFLDNVPNGQERPLFSSGGPSDIRTTEMREMFSLLVDAYRYLRCMDRNESLVTRLEKGEYFLSQVQRWRIC